MAAAAEFIAEIKPMFDPPRRYKRVSLKKEVLLRPTNNPEVLAEGVSSGWTETIGEGGLSLVTEMKVHVNQILRVSLQAGEGHVPTLIEVKWVTKMFDSWSKVGVKFLF